MSDDNDNDNDNEQELSVGDEKKIENETPPVGKIK